MKEIGHLFQEMKGNGHLFQEMRGIGHHFQEMKEIGLHFPEMKGTDHHFQEMSGIAHHSQEMSGIDLLFQEMEEIGHHSLQTMVIFHFHQEVLGIVGHHTQEMTEKDGHHIQGRKWMHGLGNKSMVPLADLYLPGEEVEGEDPHSMKITGEDPCHHLHGPHLIIPRGDGLLPDVIIGEDLHPVKNLIDLAGHHPHVMLISLMTEADHHHGIGIEKTGEDHLMRRDSENVIIQMIDGEDHPHPIGIIQSTSPLIALESGQETK